MRALLNPGNLPGQWLLIAFAAGFVLDFLLGDPRWMPHPVIGMGRAITALEKLLQTRFPSTNRGQLAAGSVLALVLPMGTFALAWGVCFVAARIHPLLGALVQAVWTAQCLAMRDLKTESMAVYHQLMQQDLPGARTAVARIVGRDTASLTEEGVTRAAVETVAENLSDGVVAPMLFLALGGAPLGLAYKAVNTMDSMVGYKNDRYLYFGRAAARLDDVCNYLPSRLSALLLIGASFLLKMDGKNAWKIWRRDRRNHASPNSAQTESACAGALNVRLAGDACYFGKIVKKPFIGDDRRPIVPQDIPRANRLLFCTGGLCFVLCFAIRWAVIAAM